MNLNNTLTFLGIYFISIGLVKLIIALAMKKRDRTDG